MPIYTGKTDNGRDAHEAFGMFINPNNENEWSSTPYNKEQRQELKDHRTYIELLEYMDGKFTFNDVYKQIKANTFRLSSRIKYYVLSHYSENGNFLNGKRRKL